jgi:hypothetical protein
VDVETDLRQECRNGRLDHGIVVDNENILFHEPDSLSNVWRELDRSSPRLFLTVD